MMNEEVLRLLLPQPEPVLDELSQSVTDWVLEQASPQVQELLRLRRTQGVERYGGELRSYNGRDPRCDLLQELTDAVLYAAQVAIEYPSAWARVRVGRLLHEVEGLAREIEEDT